MGKTNNTTTKVTKKDRFAEVRAIVEASSVENKADLLAFIDREVELLAKKSGSGKETKSQKANNIIMDTILEVLAEKTAPVTIGELMEDARLSSYTEETKDNETVNKPMTNQKLTSMVTKLLNAKKVVRTENKKKAYFSLPANDTTIEAELEENAEGNESAE